MQPGFKHKRDFMKLKTFSVSRTNDNQARLITNSESTIKINARSRWAIFLILITLAVICKQRFLHRDCAISSKLQTLSS